MNFYVLTLFPELIDGIVNTSITGRAIKKGVLRVSTVNIRDFSTRRDGRVDDYPYGGGAGMVMEAEPVAGAIASVKEKAPGARVVYLTPQGQVLTQTKAEELAREKDLVLLCGHYEGIDERVLDEYVTDYLSIGDYVLTGGELGAAVVIDAVSRFVPGVLPNEDSARFESLQDNLLEYPQYTRPVEWRGRKVPDVLLSGDHSAVSAWRAEQSLKRTGERRPDLLKNHYRVFCLTAGGDKASAAGAEFLNAVSRLGEVFDFDRRKLIKSGWQFKKNDLAIFACSPGAMTEDERFRKVKGNGTPAVILLVSDQETAGESEAAAHMRSLLEQKGFRVIAEEMLPDETEGRDIPGMAISVREKLLQLS